MWFLWFGALAFATGMAGLHTLGQDAGMLSCSPSVLKPGETFRLRFARPHPAELMVRRPDDLPLFLVYNRDDSMPVGLTPMVPPVRFRELRELNLRADSAEGSPWAAGYEQNEKVFTRAGDYVFVLREVLETDIDYPSFECRVRYQP
jgi:hypothetical protein